MSKVCHTCDWWRHIRGTDPNTGEALDEYRCSVSWLPMLMMELGRQQGLTASAVKTVANEVKKTDAESAASIGTLLTLVNRTLDVAGNAPAPALNGADRKLLGS